MEEKFHLPKVAGPYDKKQKSKKPVRHKDE